MILVLIVKRTKSRRPLETQLIGNSRRRIGLPIEPIYYTPGLTESVEPNLNAFHNPLYSGELTLSNKNEFDLIYSDFIKPTNEEKY